MNYADKSQEELAAFDSGVPKSLLGSLAAD